MKLHHTCVILLNSAVATVAKLHAYPSATYTVSFIMARQVHDGRSSSFVAGHFVAGHFVAGHFVAGHFVAGHFVAGHFVAGHFVAGHFVAGHFVAGHFVAGLVVPTFRKIVVASLSWLSFTLDVAAPRAVKTSEDTHRTAQLRILEDLKLQHKFCEDLKCRQVQKFAK